MGLKKVLLIALGVAFLVLGAVGVVVPVLPTTPFVLLAAGCFSGSSQRLSAWLRRNRVFGPYLEHYRTGQGVSMGRKVSAIAFLWTGLAISMAVVRTTWICIVLSIVGAAVTTHLLLMKTKKPEPPHCADTGLGIQ